MSPASSPRFAGAEVLSDPQLVRRFEHSGLSPHSTPLRDVVLPRDAQELSAVLREASLRRIPVYPISQGKNWGYGAATPVIPDSVVISLARMNRVLSIDRQLAIAEIEAGVTQGQLRAALEGTDLVADANGAGPNASIVGNVLERGFGHSPLGLRTRHFQVTEFLLGDGRIVHPAGAGAWAGRVGLGAGLHELLTQNNLAVVTRMRIELMRRPERSYCCVLKLRSADQLGAYVEAMRALREEGVFEGLPHLANDYRMLTAMDRFDYARWDPQRGLPETERAALRLRHGVAPWTLVAGIYGTAETGPAKLRRARKRLAPLGSLSIFRLDRTQRAARTLLDAAQRLPQRLRRSLESRLDGLRQRLGLLRLIDGDPSDVALRGCYWRHRQPPAERGPDPVHDGCGFRWLSPVLPLLRAPVEEFVALCERRYAAHGFEFGCTFTALSPRACAAVLSIYFDLESPAECERARALAAELKTEFDRRGWPSYRVAIDQMQDEIAAAPAELIALRSRIKQAFDPDGVIAPGRYSPAP